MPASFEALTTSEKGKIIQKINSVKKKNLLKFAESRKYL